MINNGIEDILISIENNVLSINTFSLNKLKQVKMYQKPRAVIT